MRSAVVLSIGLASVIACAACRSSDSSDSELRHAFHDGVWLLTVDRALRAGRPAVGVPTDPLSEADFVRWMAAHDIVWSCPRMRPASR